STNTLSVRVCECDAAGAPLSCGAVAYTATGLSTGALLAILGCILTLLGKKFAPAPLPGRVQVEHAEDGCRCGGDAFAFRLFDSRSPRLRD
uniref:Uncharacterized protein n=1 Tax=Hippocampus comes TaxID=109280 RepID=A0A3Q2YWB9_HIPCM